MPSELDQARLLGAQLQRELREPLAQLGQETEFLAQNGLKINESTKISVTGCPKHARKTGKHKTSKHAKK